LLLLLAQMKGRGDLHLLALDIGLGEGELQAAVHCWPQQRGCALENRAGGKVLRRRDGSDLENAVLLAGPHDAVLVRDFIGNPALALEGDRAHAGQFNTRAGKPGGRRTGDSATSRKRHFRHMGGAGGGLFDNGVPAGSVTLQPRNQARHVLIGGYGGEADPDTQTQQTGREQGALFLTGGSGEPLEKTSMHRRLSRTQTSTRLNSSHV